MMKRMVTVLLMIMCTWVLSGCRVLHKDTFSYSWSQTSDTYYFEEYALVYDNDELDLSIYAVKGGPAIVKEQIHYILRYNTRYVDESLTLACFDYELFNDTVEREHGVINTFLITREEFDDYCREEATFELYTTNGQLKETIPIYNDDNAGELDWKLVSDIKDQPLKIFLSDNFQLFILVFPIILATALLILLYRYIYQKNMNNFLRRKRVKKLPELLPVIITIIIINLMIISFIFVKGKQDPNFQNQLSYYYHKESDKIYLSKLEHNSGEIIASKGNIEVYYEVENANDVTFFFAYHDGEERYEIDAMAFSFSSASDFDGCDLQAFERGYEDGGFSIGYIFGCYKFVEGEKKPKFWTYNVKTIKGHNGQPIFTGFNQTYYKNKKGIYSFRHEDE